MQPSVRSLWGKAFAKQLAVNHVVLMVMCSGSNYWPGAAWIWAAKGLHSAHARRNRCYIGPVHATFAGNVDFGGAGLQTALARGEAVRTRGEAARVCTARTRCEASARTCP